MCVCADVEKLGPLPDDDDNDHEDDEKDDVSDGDGGKIIPDSQPTVDDNAADTIPERQLAVEKNATETIPDSQTVDIAPADTTTQTSPVATAPLPPKECLRALATQLIALLVQINCVCVIFGEVAWRELATTLAEGAVPECAPNRS